MLFFRIEPVRPNVSQLTTALLLLIFFFAALYTPKDYDLGWHLAYGQYFVEHHRILDKNVFSTTMPNYLWVSSSWLLDPITYLLFYRWGFVGVSVFGALVATLIFYLTIEALQLRFFEQVLTLVFLYFYLDPVLDVSFRGQSLSLAFLALVMLVLKSYERGHYRLLFFLIPVFLVWANLHTQYALGLSLMSIWLASDCLRRYLQKRPTNGALSVGIVAGSFLATLLNPRGMGIVFEIARHVDDPSQGIIREWLPFKLGSVLWLQFVMLDVGMGALFVQLFRQRKVIEHLPWVVIALTLMLASSWMGRYAWSLVVVSPFVAMPFVQELKLEKMRAFRSMLMVLLVALAGWIVFRKLPEEHVWGMSWRRYCTEIAGCSDESAQFILDHGLEKKRVWTDYRFGGWLIWNYPEIRPSMDGRMASWRDEKGYSAFEEYFKQEEGLTSIDASDYDVVYTLTSRPIYDELRELVREKKWERVYEDAHAAIFVRKEGGG